MTKRRNVLLTMLLSACLCICAMGTVMFASADNAGGELLTNLRKM